jgi:hypothetical protein
LNDVRRRAQEQATASGSISQALTDSGIEVVHRDLAGLASIYFPRRLRRPHGLLALDGTESSLATLLPLAHHFLNHQLLRGYPYGPGGAVRYSSPREEVEACAWARAFTDRVEAMHG